MRWRRLALVAVLLVASWYGLSYQRDWIFYHLWRERPSRDLSTFAEALARTELAGAAPRSLPAGLQTLPWWSIRVPAAADHAPTVCLMAGVHGNEPAGPQALLELLQDLALEAAGGPPAGVSRAVSYLVIPLANPWGWSHDLRHNAGNRDIARSVAHAGSPDDTPEAGLLRDALATADCTLLLDLHEDRFHRGFYFLAYDETEPRWLANVITGLTGTSGIAPASHAPGGLFHLRRDELASIRLTTTSLWARLRGTPHALIFESWDGVPMAQRVRLHREAIRLVVQALLAPGTPSAKTPPASPATGL